MMRFVSSTAPVAFSFAHCYESLNLLCADLETSSGTILGSAEAYHFNEERRRLNLWNEDTQADKGILDHSLRKNSELRERVLGLLRELNDAIKKAAQTHSKADDQVEKLSSDDRSTITTESGYTPEPEYEKPFSPTKSLLRDIQSIVTALFRLASTIKDPAPRDSNNRIAELSSANPDLFHVETKFPKADKRLVERLGRAAWKRRQYLMSLQQGRYGLKRHVREPIPHNSTRHNPKTWTSSISSFSHAGAGFSISTRRESTNAITSLTSPQPSISASELSEPVAEETRRLLLPRPPSPNRDFDGTEFDCPYCPMSLIDVKTPNTWRYHLMTDLEPYLCTVGGCPLSDKTYGREHDWFRHELEVHRVPKFWTCPDCQKDFMDCKEFEEHMTKDHENDFTSRELMSIVSSCERIRNTPLSNIPCPLCMTVCADQEQFRRHLGDELEQVALFALPSGTQPEDAGLDLLEHSGLELSEPIDGPVHFPSALETHVNLVERFFEKSGERSRHEITADDQSLEQSQTGYDSTIARTHGQPFRGIQSQTVSFPVTTVRHTREDSFYGRNDLLENIRNRFLKNGQTCVIHGVGGVGKTFLAVEYAHRYAEYYDCTFWLQGDTEPGLTESSTSIATELGILDGYEDPGQIVEITREWLEVTEKRWLVIVDNVEQWKAVLHCLPPQVHNTNGSVIVTTQHSELIEHADFSIPLHPLGRLDGGAMLLHYLEHSKFDEIPDFSLAQDVSELVGGLPVAIAHVAGYITYSQCPLEELLEIFLQRQEYTTGETVVDIPSSFKQPTFSNEKTLAIVCNITLRELPQDSRDLIYIMSYLNGDTVAERMLGNAHEDPSLEFLNPKEPQRYIRMKRALLRRRLIQEKYDGGEKYLSIHRELQRSVREALSQDSYKENIVFNQAIALVQKSFPKPSPIQVPEPDKWPQYRRLLPHVSSLRGVYIASKGRINGSVNFAKLLSEAGVNQWEQGISKEGIELLYTAEQVLDIDLSDDSSVMRASIHGVIGLMTESIGITQRRAGFDRRLKLFSIRRHFAAEAKKLTRDEEMLLYNAHIDLVCSLFQYNDHEQVEPILELCRAKYEEWGSEEDVPFEYAKYYRHLAVVRMYQQSYKDAISLGKHAVYWMGKSGNSNMSYRFRFDLACILLQSGDLKSALDTHKEVLSARIQYNGKNNELTLHSCYAVAVLHEAEGRLEEAEKLLQEAMDRSRAADWSKEAITRTKYHLSRVLELQGKEVEKAERLQSEAKQVLDDLLPLDMPEWLIGEEDGEILYDHLLTAFGARFTGRKLLQKFLSHPNPLKRFWSPENVSYVWAKD